MERALELLTEMEKEGGDCSPNVVTYTSVIQKLCDKGSVEGGIGYFGPNGSLWMCPKSHNG
ncbi:hypothetical protein GBA52_029203 [Prunus armeniaca]|nr:hypothetical protein GBA52_029203 [Prunus armeniaca]